MSRTVLIASLFSLQLTFGYGQRNDEIHPFRFNVQEKVGSIMDSLSNAGVDTIVSYQMYCKHCYNVHVQRRIKGEDQKVEFASLEYEQPALIIWKQRGDYYARRIDQFFRYPAVAADSLRFERIFDYLVRHFSEIASPTYIHTKVDTIVELHQQPHSVDTTRKVIRTDLDYEVIIPESNKPILTHVDIVVLMGLKKAELEVDLAWFLPLANAQSNRNGNTRENYINNLNTPLYIWMSLVEKELFRMKG